MAVEPIRLHLSRGCDLQSIYKLRLFVHHWNLVKIKKYERFNEAFYEQKKVFNILKGDCRGRKVPTFRSFKEVAKSFFFCI